MDYEKKYKEALEKARQLLDYPTTNFRSDLEDIFPELKESEDEKISREITEFILTHRIDEPNDIEDTNSWLAWLEKQCEQKPFDYENANIQQKGFASIEPKFEVGDWCIDNEDGTIFQIVKVLDNTYIYKTNEGSEYSCTHYSLENDSHLWTIKDAKEGDVLAASDDSLFIYAGVVDNCCKHYIALDKDDETIQVNDNLEYCWESVRGVRPTTKEQRDQLEKAMFDAGYKWNKEELKLEKI